MKASAIAALLGAELEGGADPEITGAAPLDRAGPTELSFVAKARYLAYVDDSGAGLLVVAESLADRVGTDRPLVRVADVHAGLAAVLPALYPERPPEPGIHPTAVIADDVELGPAVTAGPYVVVGRGARLGSRVRLGPHAVVGEGCEIGDDVVVHPHVTLYPGVRVGARTILHAGVRLGVDGFGYAPVDGVPRKVPQVGRLDVGADVEIGANTTVDRGSVGATEIGDHVKIDNLVHVAHNVRIGAGSIVVAQVGIAGSTRLGRGVTVAGQAGLGGHSEIGDGATIGGQAGVFGDVPAGAVYSGYPARPHQEALRAQAALFRLPKLLERLRALEAAVKEWRTKG